MPPASSNTGRAVRKRKIADLTAEQIQRKRDVDRQAQHAFRERSKTQIRNLEQELRRQSLKSDGVIRDLRAENERLHARIDQMNHQLRRIGHIALEQQQHTVTLGEASLDSGATHHHDTRSTQHMATPCLGMVQDERILASNNLYDRDSNQLNEYEDLQQHVAGLNHSHSVLCEHLAPTCPFDHILVGVLQSRHQALLSGESLHTIMGPSHTDIAGLFDRSKLSTSHHLSRIIVEVMNTFQHVRLAERVGFMYKIHKTLRWHIAPSNSTYHVLPNWLRPTTVQLETPHGAWIDNIPWPDVRDLLVRYQETYPFNEFSEVYSHNVSVNWPHGDADIIVELPNPDGENHAQAIINPIFERHICDLRNWTVCEEFAETYPEMQVAIEAAIKRHSA